MKLGSPAARTPSPAFSDPGQDRDPGPPRWEVYELMRLGAIDPAHVRLPALERCRCGHQPQVHDEILLPFRDRGRCNAKPCRKGFTQCDGYELDPRFGRIPGRGEAVKLKVNEDNTLTRA